VYGRMKKEQDVRYFYKGTKRSFAEGFARHHHMVNNKPVFNPGGTSDKSTPAETTFKQHWPKEVEKAKWWECVCLKCEVVDLALRDLLDLIKAAHKGSDYQKHVHGVAGQCQDTKCYWYKQAAEKKLPTGTSNCAMYCLSKEESKKHCVPFLLCRECKCQNPNSPQQDAKCHFRNGKSCKSDGIGLLRWQPQTVSQSVNQVTNLVPQPNLVASHMENPGNSGKTFVTTPNSQAPHTPTLNQHTYHPLPTLFTRRLSRNPFSASASEKFANLKTLPEKPSPNQKPYHRNGASLPDTTPPRDLSTCPP